MKLTTRFSLQRHRRGSPSAGLQSRSALPLPVLRSLKKKKKKISLAGKKKSKLSVTPDPAGEHCCPLTSRHWGRGEIRSCRCPGWGPHGHPPLSRDSWGPGVGRVEPGPREIGGGWGDQPGEQRGERLETQRQRHIKAGRVGETEKKQRQRPRGKQITETQTTLPTFNFLLSS